MLLPDGSGIERVVIVTMATATDHLTGEINGTNDRVEHVQDLIGNVHDDVQELKNDLEGLKGEFREFANHAYQVRLMALQWRNHSSMFMSSNTMQIQVLLPFRSRSSGFQTAAGLTRHLCVC